MAEDLRLQKGQEHLHVTKKDKKNQKGIRMGPAPQGERVMKEERFPHSECALTGRQGDQQGQSVSCGALEESAVEQFTEGRMKRALQTGDATFPTLPASDTCPTIWAETVCDAQALEIRPKERTGGGCQKQPSEARSLRSANGNHYIQNG